MIIKIKTERGSMEVDLDEFFPADVSRRRKLFKLMRTGVSADQLQEVREYLATREQEAVKEKMSCARDLQDLEEDLVKLNSALARVKEEKRRTQGRIREAERLEKLAPVWRKEFEYICGD